ncbi:antitoxin [Duganella aquatilis]|uniref:antitoxin n=1 Tax=Duganella aquatilis TaxID=2666082 RepID=UPI001AA081EB|nr:antitoxin [Duganella aquatilis]
MRKEYDFSKAKPVPNPYFEKLSKEVTFRLDFNSIAYFQKIAKSYGFSMEKVIQLSLQRLARSGEEFNIGFPTLEERNNLDTYLEKQNDPPDVR